MGYFPLPELKGKPNRIFVDGKTLNQIAKESGIRLDTVQHRYSRGIRDYEGLTKPSHISVEHEKAQRKTYSIMSAGERVMERIWELDIPLQTISDKTGISRSTIYAFLYNGTDLSSMRLATWIKQNKKADTLFWGMGNWTRANAELCLLGVRGKPKRMDAGVHSVIMSHIEEHSKKPAETRDRIVKLMAGGGLPKIELFARQCIDGWDCWGNEV